VAVHVGQNGALRLQRKQQRGGARKRLNVRPAVQIGREETQKMRDRALLAANPFQKRLETKHTR